MNNSIRVILATVLASMALPPSSHAQGRVPDLSQISIEDLMKIEITGAGRKEQRAFDVAAAVFVITQEDIRRSGMTTIPDLLRLAPGVDVAQINSNKWAVSVRGFNSMYANKLLVLIDGRSVYNRLFSGVLWDAQDLMLDDVDRIEVIRGPGAAMWGANAVNGVINIVTKAAVETQGGLVRADGGRFGGQGAVRHGGALGSAHYRVYAQWTGREETLITAGTRAGDAAHSVTTGFRSDWAARPGRFTLAGAFTAGKAHALWLNLDPQTSVTEPIATAASSMNGGNLLGRWTATRSGGSTMQIQSFVDFAGRREPVGHYHRSAIDVDSQFRVKLGERQDIVAGAGYRFVHEGFEGRSGFSLSPAQVEDSASLLTAFIQDEIALFGKRLALTLGSQVQYGSDSGADVQPTARVMWMGLPRQRLWAATSRAVRTPSMTDRGVHIELLPVPNTSGLPLAVTVVGNPAAKTERLVDAEAGYRLEVGTVASFDLTAFAGRYNQLQTQEPGAPAVVFVPSPHIEVLTQFGNQLDATTRGFELGAQWTPVPAWRLDGSYTHFTLIRRLAATSRDPDLGRDDGSSPRRQWQVRSTLAPGTRATLAVSIFHVGPLERYNVSAYTRGDVTGEWRFTNGLSLMAIGQNLFETSHEEFAGSASLLQATGVPRSASLRLRWTFQ